MLINIVDDIHSITDLKKNTHAILNQAHATGRPIVLTVNGKTSAVLLDAKEYEKIMSAFKMLQLLIPAEEDVTEGRTKEIKSFFKEFKRAKNI